jgi:hypothetical protein
MLLFKNHKAMILIYRRNQGDNCFGFSSKLNHSKLIIKNITIKVIIKYFWWGFGALN